MLPKVKLTHFEAYTFISKLPQERIEIMNRSIINENIGSVIKKKNSQQRKAHNEMASVINSTKYIKKS